MEYRIVSNGKHFKPQVKFLKFFWKDYQVLSPYGYGELIFDSYEKCQKYMNNENKNDIWKVCNEN